MKKLKEWSFQPIACGVGDKILFSAKLKNINRAYNHECQTKQVINYLAVYQSDFDGIENAYIFVAGYRKEQ